MTQPALSQSLKRGLACRCPHCGEGKLFKSYLKTCEQCPVCGEEFHHHRADDFPAYIVVLILAHVMVSFGFWVEDAFAPPLWVHAVTTVPLSFILAVAMLQPVKGAVIALQWHMGMHGFGASRKKRDQSAGNNETL